MFALIQTNHIHLARSNCIFYTAFTVCSISLFKIVSTYSLSIKQNILNWNNNVLH